MNLSIKNREFTPLEIEIIKACANGTITKYRLSKILEVSRPTAKRIVEKAKTQLSA